MTFTAGVGAKLGISGVFEFRDKDGNILKTMEVIGSIPLEKLDMNVEQARQLINESGQENGSDNRK